MTPDLGLTATNFGLGAGGGCVGSFICVIPSNLALARFGARMWIARIMLTWGLLSMGMAFVQGVTSFMVLRFLLGVAEAGFFPGVILYMTFWFPAAWRARVTAAFMVAIPASVMLAGPVSNWAMAVGPAEWGLKPWQYLFLIEGLPTVLLAFAVLKFLPNRPSEASWLTAEEKSWLEEKLASENRGIAAKHGVTGLGALSDPRVLALSFIYFANLSTVLGITFFLPQIIRGMGATDANANLISSLPGIVGIVGVLFFGWLADHFRQRRKALLLLALTISTAGLAGAGLIGPTYAALVLIAFANFGIYGAKGPFWPLPSMFLTGTAAASGIALINSVGNLGGFAGPFLLGYVKDHTGSYAMGLYMLAALAAAAAIVTQLLKTPSMVEEDK
jgi:MFS family permease